MACLQHLSIPEVHVYAARQTGIEAAHSTHDVDSLEFVRAVLLEDRRILHCIFIRSRSSIHIAWVGIPGSRRIWVIVGDLVIANHDVMRQNSARRFVEAAANGFLRHLEIIPGLCTAGMQLRQRLLGKMKRARGCISLEISARPIPLDRVAPLWNLPLKLYLWFRHGLGQINLDALSGRLDIADVNKTCQRRRPETRDWAATGIKCQIVFRPLVIPTWGHNPGVLIFEVTFLWLGESALIPGMALIDRIAQRIFSDKGLGVLPVVIIRATEQNPDVQVDIHKVRCHQLAVDNYARGKKTSAAPVRHLLVGVITDVRVIERSPTSQKYPPAPHFFISRKGLVEEIEQIIMERNDLLHELHILHQPDDVVREQLNSGHSADAAWIQSGR